MNHQFAKKATLLFFCFVGITFGLAQNNSIEAAFRDAMNFNNIVDKGNGSFEFRAGGCNFSFKDFDNYVKSHPQYKITEVVYEQHYRFGYYKPDHICGFSFRLNDNSSSALEQAIRVANNNMSLKMPIYHDVKAADLFYRQYVKKYPKLAETYKKEFNADFMSYMMQSPNRIIDFFKGCPYNSELLAGFDVWTFLGEIAKSDRDIFLFCDKSPYDQEYLKDVDMLNFLESHRVDGKTYVYMRKPNEGYIVNKDMSYSGGIVNKQMHGWGVLEEKVYDKGVIFVNRKAKDTYTGEFKNGIKNGSMTHKWEGKSYTATNDKIYSKVFVFRFEESGIMVNNRWNGTTDFKAIYEIKRLIHSDTYYEDHIKKHYDNGIFVSQTVVQDRLTSHLIAVNPDAQAYSSMKIPRVKKVERSDSGVYAVYYMDGTVAYQAYFYEDGILKCADGVEHNFIKTEDQAQRYAYLWINYDNAHDMVVKIGLPPWQ